VQHSLRAKRVVAIFVALGLGVLAFLAELYLTPRSFFSSPLYWSGFAVFTIVGAFPYVSTSTRVTKLTGFAITAGGVSLAIASQRYPQALEFGFGLPAILVGVGIRIMYMIIRKR